MKVKPKEVFVNLPVVLMFDSANEIPLFAANINTILHGKVKLKYEELGLLGAQEVAIFYLQRNNEYSELRDQFRALIESQELAEYNKDYEMDQE